MNVLIVEDEVLIADMLERYLFKKGYKIVGKAISYQEALNILEEEEVDLALLDIRLNGPETGIDLAKYIQEFYPTLGYIYLTSQMDQQNIEAAKVTLPLAYLSKPIQKESLYATIEMASYKKNSVEKDKYLQIQLGTEYEKILKDDILFFEADHVYVKLYLEGKKQPHLLRQTLKELSSLLSPQKFQRAHRSFLVNLEKVERWNRSSLYIKEYEIPISRSKKEQFLAILEEK